MPGTIVLNDAVKDARLQAIADAVNTGGSPTERPYINLYDGTQPSGPGIAVTTQQLIATMPCSWPFQASIVGGVLTLDTVDSGLALITATTTWARVFNFDDVAVYDGGCGLEASGQAFEMPAVAFLAGSLAKVTSGTITEQ